MRFAHYITLLLLGLLSGCASLQSPPPAGAPSQPTELPFAEPEPAAKELDADIVFSALAGEIALQRGELELAYRHQLQTALLAGDPVAAERATRIATALKKDRLALDAARRWVELAPNSVAARQQAAAQLLRNGQPDQALEQLEALLLIGDARGEDGFLHALSALSKLPQRPQALQLMERLTARHPDDSRGGYALALLLLMSQAYDRAEQQIIRVIRQRPDWSRAHILHARIHSAQGDGERAIALLEQATEKLPDDAGLQTALARLLVENDRYDEAYRRYQRADRLQPGNEATTFALGVLALQLQRTDAARDYFLALRKRGQRSDQAAYYLGRTEQQANNPQQAIDWYKRVEEGDLYHDAQIRIARALADQGKVQQALDWIEGLRRKMREESAILYLAEAEILTEHGTEQQVLALYERALNALPGNTRLLYARGIFGARIGRVDLLERDMREIIRNDPDNVDALNALGYTLADQTTRYAEARRYIERAMQLKPDSPAILDSMGWLHYRLGNLPEALDYLQRAFDKLIDPEVAAHLGEVLWVSGRQDEARRVWQRILDDDPDNRFVIDARERLTR